MEEAQVTQTTAPAQQTTASYIDNYCERNHRPEPLAEPLNLVTNIVFVISALIIFRMLRAYKQIALRNLDVIILTITLAVIGFGSAAYHSFPNGKTVLMDVIPIGIFIHLYLLSFARRIIGLNYIFCVIFLAAFIGLGMYFQNNFSPDTLNGTIMYVPTYLTLMLMVIVMAFVKQNHLYLHVINTAVIWTFSLAFRTVDMQLCTHTYNIGTHFLWHALNGIVLYRLLAVLVLDRAARTEVAAG